MILRDSTMQTTRVLLAGRGRDGRPCKRTKRRVAHLSRPSERQPSQPAERDQHQQRHRPRAQVDVSDFRREANARCRSRLWSSAA